MTSLPKSKSLGPIGSAGIDPQPVRTGGDVGDAKGAIGVCGTVETLQRAVWPRDQSGRKYWIGKPL